MTDGMTKLGVVYYTGGGTTARFADAVAEGAKSAGCDVYVHQIAGSEIQEGRWQNDSVLSELDACDAVVFGSPTYMGGVAAQMKAFMDALAPRWYSQAWNGKRAGAFTVSAKRSGDKLNCLLECVLKCLPLAKVQ